MSGRHGKNRHSLAPAANGRPRGPAAGFTLAELIVVCALISRRRRHHHPGHPADDQPRQERQRLGCPADLHRRRPRPRRRRAAQHRADLPRRPTACSSTRIEVPSRRPDRRRRSCSSKAAQALHAASPARIPDTPDAFGAAAATNFTGTAPVHVHERRLAGGFQRLMSST